MRKKELEVAEENGNGNRREEDGRNTKRKDAEEEGVRRRR